MSKRHVFYNSISGGVLFGVNIVVAFFLSPVVVRELHDYGYGIWEILLSVFGYLGILELGVGPAFVRFVARAAAQNDRVTMNRVVSSALAVLAGVGLLGFLAINALFLAPERFLNIDTRAVPESRVLGLLLGLNFLVELIATAFSAYMMGIQRHYVMNAVRIPLVVLQAVVTYLALTRWSGPGLAWLAAILLGVSSVQLAVFSAWTLARDLSPQIRLSHVNRSTIRELYAFGLKSVMFLAAGRVPYWAVPIVIGWVLGLGQVVFYAIPNRLAAYAAGLGTTLAFPLMPYFSALDGKGERNAILSAWFITTRTLQFVMFGMAVAMLVLGGPFITRWIGSDYAVNGAWVIRCLSVALFIEAISPNAGRVLISMNRHGRPAATGLAIALVGLPVTILLAKVAGVTGVGISVLLIRGSMAILWLALTLRVLKLGMWEHLRRTALSIIPATSLFAAVCVGLRHLHEADDYARLAVYGSVGGLTYALAIWLFALRGQERDAILRFIRMSRLFAIANKREI